MSLDAALDAVKAKYFAGKEPSLNVERLRISGLSRIQPRVVEREFAAVMGARSFSDVLRESDAAAKSLRSLGVFEDVEVVCDEGSTPSTTRVYVNVKERNAFTFKAGSFVGTEELNFMASGEVRNPFGGAEKLELSSNYGTKNKLSFSLQYIQPRFLDRKTEFTWRVFNFNQNKRQMCGHDERDLGMLMSVRGSWRGFVPKLSHELTWRTIAVNSTASTTLKEEALSELGSLKSALQFLVVRDRRNDPAFPTRGTFLQYRQEFAGLGGNVFFTKHELTAAAYLPLLRGLSLALSGSAGLLRPLFGDHTRVADRFFVGGGTSMRGFAMRGLGVLDKDTHTHLGGDLYGLLSAILSMPLPSHLLPGLRARAQLFLNAGNLVASQSASTFRERVSELVSQYRLSAGAGVVLGTPFGRVEINYCVPLRVFAEDNVQSFQFGLGMGF